MKAAFGGDAGDLAHGHDPPYAAGWQLAIDLVVMWRASLRAQMALWGRPTGHERQRLHAAERLFGAARVHGGQRPVVTACSSR
jgi:hypothetical protein